MTHPAARPAPTHPLEQSLMWLKTPDCACPHEWKSYGSLYRIPMGYGWVRMTTDPACRHHAAARPPSVGAEDVSRDGPGGS